MPVTISKSIQGAVLIVALQGQLDGLTSPIAEKEILALISAVQCQVVLDMDQITFMSSAGLRMILSIVRETQRLGGALRLARPQPAVADTVKMGFSNLIQTFGSVPGAVSSFNRQQAKVVWDDHFFDQMRQIGDPAADDAIEALFDQGQIEAVNGLMKELVNNDYLPSASLPSVIRNYLANTSGLPSWADSNRIRRGESLFGRYGLQMVLILCHASLPAAFAAPKGAHVLYLTQRMNRNPYRRIMETAQLLLDVMEPGGLEQEGRGLRSAQKVRLMHAAVRHLLRHSPQWDLSLYDHPINQEDLAGTLMTFSYAIINRLPLLGVELNEEQQEDFLHVWNVCGYVMGVMPELLPENIEAATQLSEKIAQRQVFSSTGEHLEGRELTTMLIKMLRESIPGGLFDALPPTLMRHLLGDQVADILAIERTSWARAIRPLQWANHMLQESGDRIPMIASISEVFCRKMLAGLMIHDLGGNRTNFHIPEVLREDWKLEVDTQS